MQNSLSNVNEIRRLISIGSKAEAEQLCRQVLQVKPELDEVWFLLAQIAVSFCEFPDALYCVQKAFQLDPKQDHYLFLHAHILYETGDVEAGYKLLKPLMSSEQPSTVQALFGRISWRAGYYNNALAAFAACAAHVPVNEVRVLPYLRALAGLGARVQLIQQFESLKSTAAFGAESALLFLHTKLAYEPIESVFETAVEFSKTFPDHKGIEQFRLFLAIWSGRAELSTTCFQQHFQLKSVRHVLERRDKNTKLAGLPVEVLEHSAEIASQSGLWLEFGVCFGRSINIMAKFRKGDVHGFDSFQGLPEDWKEGEPKGSYSTGGRLPEVSSNIQLHTGWFEESLPEFLSQHKETVSLLHIDCDLFSSTQTVLSQLANRLKAGTIIVFDDFLGFEGFEQHEFKAFSEFSSQHGLKFRLLSYAALSREVAFQLE